jgi:hypothetical protein
VTVPPHPSGPEYPQRLVQVIGVQQVPLERHTSRVGSEHMPPLPQTSCPPHPSEMVPQLFPSAAQVVFVQHV